MRPVELLRAVYPGARGEYVESFDRSDAYFQQVDVTTPLRLAHFMAQCALETTGYTALRENMNYKTAERIEAVFGRRHSAQVNIAEARSLVGQPEKLAERVYGLGNPKKAKDLGNTQTGDGWRFRGGGMKQLTGRWNYEQFGKVVGLDLAAHPEWVTHPDYAVRLALLYWNAKRCNPLADADDLLSVSRAVNLGNAHAQAVPNGLADRRLALNKLLPVIKAAGVSFDGKPPPVAKPTLVPPPATGKPVDRPPVAPVPQRPVPPPPHGAPNAAAGGGFLAALFAAISKLFGRTS